MGQFESRNSEKDRFKPSQKRRFWFVVCSSFLPRSPLEEAPGSLLGLLGTSSSSFCNLGQSQKVGKVAEKGVGGAIFGDTEGFRRIGFEGFWFGVFRHLGRFGFEKNPMDVTRNSWSVGRYWKIWKIEFLGCLVFGILLSGSIEIRDEFNCPCSKALEALKIGDFWVVRPRRDFSIWVGGCLRK